MPRFFIIYVKRTEKTPRTTTITFTFPDGQTVDYKSDNVILEDFTKPDIIVLPFPFADLSSSKRHPAFILTVYVCVGTVQNSPVSAFGCQDYQSGAAP